MPVARTKLRPPATAAAVWPTGLVDDVMAGVVAAPCVVVRADAGSGKTTLARTVVERLSAPWGWVRVDRYDDLATFAELLTLALGGAAPALGAALGPVDVGSDPDAARRVAVGMVNAVVRAPPNRVVLVIDDAHELPTDALRLLDELVQLAPPGLHLLVTTRQPLAGVTTARSLALGHVVEVSADRLRAGPAEVARLATARGLELDDAGVQELVDRTGGWVLGVCLVLDGHSDTPTGTDLVARYLGEEVLGQRGPVELGRLQTVSVLEAVSESAVAAMLEVPDPRGWLRALTDALPMLTEWLDDGSVRIHDLAREVLRDGLRADPERWRRAHTAAAALAETWQDQTRHLLGAGDADGAAVVLVDQARHDLPNPGPLARIDEHARSLPSDVRERHPWLDLVAGAVAVQGRADPSAAELLESVLDRLDDDDWLGRWAVLRFCIVVGEDRSRWLAALQRLERSGGLEDVPTTIRVEHDLALAHGAFYAGDLETAADRHGHALELAMASGDPDVLAAVAQHTSPQMLRAHGAVGGDLERVDDFMEWVLAQPGPTRAVTTCAARAVRALLRLLRGDLDDALAEVRASHGLVDQVSAGYVRLTISWVEGTVLFARGDHLAATRALGRGGVVHLTPVAALARVYVETGQRQALHALATGTTAFPVRGPAAAMFSTALVVARAQAARADGQFEDAAALLEPIVSNGSEGFVPGVGRPALDLVVALGQAARDDEAHSVVLDELAALDRRGWLGLVACQGQALRPALERVAAGGVHSGPARRALALLSDTGATGARLDADTSLTAREVDVLRLLAAGRSNREIADELVISANTVKTHVRHVYEKLEVSTRAAAAARAVRLGLGPTEA